MNIAFDMSFTLSESNERGIGRYSKNLINAIVKESEDHTYHYFYPESEHDPVHLQEQLQHFLTTHDIHLFNILSPFEWKFPTLNKSWFGSTKVAVVLHDVIPLIFSEMYLVHEHERERYMNALDFVKSCDLILANSDATKQDAINKAGISPEKIIVIYGGVEDRFHIMDVTDKDLKKYGIVKPYVMCTGGMDYRKNLSSLIQAFGKANEELHHHYQLVIVC